MVETDRVLPWAVEKTSESTTAVEPYSVDTNMVLPCNVEKLILSPFMLEPDRVENTVS